MQREHWLELSAAISQVAARWPRHPRDQHSTAILVRVYLWAVIHQAAVSWACDPRNWDHRTRPLRLPDQSTLSRRMRRGDFTAFLQRLSDRMRGSDTGLRLIKRLDAKPLPLPAHSTDPQAGWGRGAGQRVKGYKLHMLSADRPFPEQFRVAPLQVSEQEMARRMLRDLCGAGYVLADKNYDANALFDQAAARGHQLIAPRRYGAHRGLGHHRHSPQRLRCKDLLEVPLAQQSGFGPQLRDRRRDIERQFAHSVAFTGGLIVLPPWVRGYHRVHFWVWAKLLINAARIRCRQRKQRIGA
jgi:hypothetical protein